MIEHALEANRLRVGAGQSPEEITEAISKLAPRRCRLLTGYEKGPMILEELNATAQTRWMLKDRARSTSLLPWSYAAICED